MPDDPFCHHSDERDLCVEWIHHHLVVLPKLFISSSCRKKERKKERKRHTQKPTAATTRLGRVYSWDEDFWVNWKILLRSFPPYWLIPRYYPDRHVSLKNSFPL